ncbi:glucoside xylosyltransferase 1-like [Hyalella azteca]|uniref:Glucoside xylosyltransferase 1-like n=1 Tax=Hyalella azteca TaxID=294128 RepID=A0A979FK80_HYAAZ|nr:glucoside xylosyltransferase 1-like [Hyalella azteca]
MFRRCSRILTVMLYLILTASIYSSFKALFGLSVTVRINSMKDHERIDVETQTTPFVLILCNDGNYLRFPEIAMTKFEIQLRQAKTLIKSAVKLSKSSIRFIILGNDDTVLLALKTFVSEWPPLLRSRLTLSYRPVFIPEGWHLMDLYEKCVTEKLFLPWVLPEFDAVVYMDTDHVFMRPPEHLTQHFKYFDEKQVLGVAPVDGFYLQFNTENYKN